MAKHRTPADAARAKAVGPRQIRALRTGAHTNTMAQAAAVSEDKPLTEKQKAYAIARARGETVPNSMLAAGYNEQVSYGYRLDKMPNVQRLMRQEQALYAAAAQIDRKKVIDMHLEAFDMAKLINEPASMVSAAREIGKICGLYEPKKVDISINGKVEHELRRLEGMSDAELLEVIMNGGAQLALAGSDEGPAPENTYGAAV